MKRAELAWSLLALVLIVACQEPGQQSDSGLELVGGKLTILRGCADDEILKWDETQDDWNCETGAGFVVVERSTFWTGLAGGGNVAIMRVESLADGVPCAVVVRAGLGVAVSCDWALRQLTPIGSEVCEP